MNFYLSNRLKTVLALAALLSLSPAWATEIYVYKDKNGHVHLTDKPPHKGFQKITSREWMHKPMASLDTASFAENRKKYKQLIGKAARRYRVSEALLDAVVTAESAYDPRAVSRAGAVGLMQLMPGTADRYGASDRYNPESNVYAGTRYLRDLLKQFGDTKLALAAYNAGENNVIKYGYKIPPFKETQHYVRKVLHYFDKYQETL